MRGQRLCEFMVDNLEGFVPPPDFKPAKKVRRIEFPHEKVTSILAPFEHGSTIVPS